MWSDENPSSGYTDTQASFRLDLARREEADEPQQGEQLARRRRAGAATSAPRRHAGARSEASLGRQAGRGRRSLRETAERYALTPPTANGCAR